MAVTNENVSDWSTTASSNTPADGDAISTDLANNAFTDPKKAVRVESTRKNWEVSGRACTNVNATTIRLTGGPTVSDEYHVHQAVKIERSSGNDIGGYVASISEGSNTDITLYDIYESNGTPATVGATVQKAYFGVHRPRGTDTSITTKSYPNTPSCFPPNFQTSCCTVLGSQRRGVVTWAFPFLDSQYYCAVQVIGTENNSGTTITSAMDRGLDVSRIMKFPDSAWIFMLDEWTGDSRDKIALEVIAFKQYGGGFL